MNKNYLALAIITGLLSACNGGGDSSSETFKSGASGLAVPGAGQSVAYGESVVITGYLPTTTYNLRIDFGAIAAGNICQTSPNNIFGPTACSCYTTNGESCSIIIFNTNNSGYLEYPPPIQVVPDHYTGVGATLPIFYYNLDTLIRSTASVNPVPYGATTVITASVPVPATATMTFSPPTGCIGTMGTYNSSTCQLNNTISCSVILTNTNTDSTCGYGDITISSPGFVSFTQTILLYPQ